MKSKQTKGNGSFIKGIKSITNNFKFYDLEPDNEEIIKQDYLLYDYDNIKKIYSKIHIIGNPPFGRQSSLAIKFIKKSCEFCDTISFILPLNFIFVGKTKNPDISFRRVGVNAGIIDVNIDNKSIQSHYFIKFTNNKSISDNIDLLKVIQFNHNNTVGPRSISKQELIKEFNKYI
jgi:hypothetical protein